MQRLARNPERSETPPEFITPASLGGLDRAEPPLFCHASHVAYGKACAISARGRANGKAGWLNTLGMMYEGLMPWREARVGQGREAYSASACPHPPTENADYWSSSKMGRGGGQRNDRVSPFLQPSLSL